MMFRGGLAAATGIASRVVGGSSAQVRPAPAEEAGADDGAPVEKLGPEQAGPVSGEEEHHGNARGGGAAAASSAGPTEPRREDGGAPAAEAGWASRITGVATHAAGAAASAARGAADLAAPAAADAASTVAAAAMKAGELAVPVASGAASLAVAGASAGASATGQAAVMAAEAGKAAAINAKQWAQEKLQEFKEMMEMWVKRKIHSVASRAVDKVPPAIKNALEDEEMPRCVSRGKDQMVDSVWPHVREEVLWELAVYLDGEPANQKEDEEDRGVDCCRAFFRYHLYPFDKTIWRILRDPVWWVFTLISLVPVHGISPVIFLFRFLIIDKSDEFQLIQFILSFKGMQFITQGIIRSITGYVAFVGCVTAPAAEDQHECEGSGPGVYGKAGIAGLAGYLLTCILVWISFALLRCATGKGRAKLHGVLAESALNERVTGQKGGLLVYFLWWDIFVLLVCVGVCAWVMTTRPEFSLDDWAFSHVAFAAQIVHGLMSAPFFFFTLPGLARVLTHSQPTAYDRHGRCVPPKKTAAADHARKEAAAQPRPEVVSEEEAAELWSRLRSKAGLPRVPGFSD